MVNILHCQFIVSGGSSGPSPYIFDICIFCISLFSADHNLEKKLAYKT